MTDILIPGSPGELVDKITILELKLNHIQDPEKRTNIEYELHQLTTVFGTHVPNTPTIHTLKTALKSVNQQLWTIEDDIRICERHQDFGPRFIELARAVYITNDQRAAIKKDINLHLNSAIVEEKSYQSYRPV